MKVDHTHDPRASSWVEGADGHAAFPVQNLPLGIFAPMGGQSRIGTAIGDYILDLAPLPATCPPSLLIDLAMTNRNWTACWLSRICR